MYRIGGVFVFRMKGWRDPILGQVLMESDEWLLLRHVPIDFMVDGYKLLRKPLIAEANRSEAEEKIEQVFALRGWQPVAPQGFQLESTIKILDWIERSGHFFQVQDADESMIVIGRMDHLRAPNELVMDSVDEHGVMYEASEPAIDLDEIRTIEFGTDYLDAIYLLWSADQKRL